MNDLLPTSLLCLFLLCLGCGSARVTTENDGPELPYAKLIRNAETAEAGGDYAGAADYYRRAYDRKPGRQEPLYRAAELYTRVHDYRAAADAYQFVTDREDYPLLGLYYGRALKQDGRYDRARRELSDFLEGYNGADRPIVAEIVRNELAGIALAQAQAGAPTTMDLERPGRGINTTADELGPVAVAGDQLLFTSTAGRQSRLYQSRLRAREWTKATVPPGFPVIAEGEFGTGSMSADGRVFYFSICSGLSGTDAGNRCELFRGERSQSGAWRQPEKLGEQINLAETNNAHPFVTFADGREYLYFASDRPGGRGGMDLYFTTRPLDSPDGQFGVPANLGPAINTVSDEVSPFYDVSNQTLYFASDGHPSIGGLDLFRSSGASGSWSRPENLGRPINSVADDHGLSIAPGGRLGYLASNRSYPGLKDNTTEFDLFRINLAAGRARLKATVYDNTTGMEVSGTEVTLFDLTAGQPREIGRRVFPTGVYDYDLRPGSRYRVVIRRAGYKTAEYEITTREDGSALYGQPIFLQPLALGETDTGGSSAYPDIRPTAPTTTTTPPPPPPPTTTTPGPVTPPPPVTVDPQPEVAYRIQISAQARFDPAEGKYEAIRSLGDLRAEPIPNRNLQRITVGYYTDKAAARRALAQVQASGFPSAFAVRYDRGSRYGMVNLNR